LFNFALAQQLGVAVASPEYICQNLFPAGFCSPQMVAKIAIIMTDAEAARVEPARAVTLVLTVKTVFLSTLSLCGC
jgi:hypothetical protein